MQALQPDHKAEWANAVRRDDFFERHVINGHFVLPTPKPPVVLMRRDWTAITLMAMIIVLFAGLFAAGAIAYFHARVTTGTL